MRKYNAFTLVELIVVIVILSILATIAFLSFWSQSSSARDSIRLSDVASISKGIWVKIVTSWVYPAPDKSINILFWTWVIWYQWEFWDTWKRTIWVNLTSFKDPLDSLNYLYTVNASKNKFKLWTLLENKSSSALKYYFWENADAVYDFRYLYVTWDWVWIMTSNSWTSILTAQEVATANSLTWINVAAPPAWSNLVLSTANNTTQTVAPTTLETFVTPTSPSTTSDPNTMFLMNCEWSITNAWSEPVTFTDNNGSQKVAVSSTTFKNWFSSCYFKWWDTFLKVTPTNIANFTFSSSKDFTIDFYMMPEDITYNHAWYTLTQAQWLFWWADMQWNSIIFNHNSNNRMNYITRDTGWWWAWCFSLTNAKNDFKNNTWYYIKLVRTWWFYKMYVDWTLDVTCPVNWDLSAISWFLRIGTWPADIYTFKWWIDDFRISNIAR